MLTVLASQPSVAPHVVLIVLGFVIGGLGSAHKSRPVTALGILLVVIATASFQWRLYDASSN